MKLPLVVCCVSLVASAATGSVTFSRDVAPILQKNCQGCHRPGEAAPMSLETYQQARPWAKAMKQAVLARKMPPWFADPQYGHFRNDRSLAEKDIDTLVAWVDAGAPEGDPKDLPKAVEFVDGWNIGKPDVVYEMPKPFQVPASGTIEYQYVILPYPFPEDRWVQMAEVRPGNRAVVHHVIAYIRDSSSKWMRDKKPGETFVPEADEKGNRPSLNGDLLTGFAPGLPPSILEPGQGRLIKAGSDIVLQLHYTTNGTATTDQTRIGLIFAKEPPEYRQLTMSAPNNKFVIPAGDPAYEVKSQITLQDDAQLVNLMPHMHLRGKDFLYKAVYPTGETSTLLSVPKYDFNWQLVYYLAQPLTMPKGTRIECTAHFDNSPNNPANPNPSKEVKWGDQSWEEMMIGWFDVMVPAKADPMNLYRTKKSD